MASVKVHIPSVLQDEIYVQAEKIIDVLNEIAKEHNSISNMLFLADRVSPNVILFINRERVFDLNLALNDEDFIQIIFAISGGEKSLEELNNYSKYLRQINLPQVGIKGQDKIFNSRILLIGAGGLGTPTSIYLAAAGVGNIGIVDGDTVEESNLARQVMYTSDDLDKKKVECLEKALKKINPKTKIDIYPTYLNKNNATELIEKYDLVINGTDNFKTRYIVNKVCSKLKKTWIDSSVLQLTGNIVTFKSGNGCYECLFPGLIDSEKNCSTEGILGPLCGIFGSFQALEALKILLEVNKNTDNYMYYYNGISESFQKLSWNKREDCLVCGKK